jgi:hypothetical protein
VCVPVLNKSARVLLVVSFCYVTTYVLMLDWRRPAYDPIARIPVDQSAYRFAHAVGGRVPGPFTIYEAFDSLCWANRVFWPIDSLVRRALAHIDERAKDLALIQATTHPTFSVPPTRAPRK